MAQAFGSRFLALADELLIGVIEQLESKEDLCSLVLACSRLQGLAEPALYRSILIRKGAQALRLSEAILNRRVRGSLIRNIHIRYQHVYREGIEILNDSLKRMCNLKELLIEGPCCNDTFAILGDIDCKGQIDYAEFFAFASSMTLESQPRVQVPLQSFTLHSHNTGGTGRDAFNMGSNAIIFLHPTLRNLTISCFDVGEDIEAYLIERPNSTSLRSLKFDECNITVKGLAAILSTPKALERLTLGERMYHKSGYDHTPLGRSPELFLQALALQKDSLQYLKHIGGRRVRDVPVNITGLSMADFVSMREMNLETHSILAAILSATTTLESFSVPAGLYLRLIQKYLPADVIGEGENPIVASIHNWFKVFPHLDFIIDLNVAQDLNGSFTDLLQVMKIHKIWKKIFDLAASDATRANNSRKVQRLRILMVQSSGFIPPYMYGEPRPVEALVFDSDSHSAR